MRLLISTALGCALAWPCLAAPVNITVRDVTTGYAVPATVLITSVEEGRFGPETATADRFGHLSLEVGELGHYLVEISASGYESQRTHFYIESADGVSFQANLSSVEPPPEYRPDVFDSKLRPGYNLIHGFVVATETGEPLAGASVAATKTGVRTQTDSRGYFELYAPSSPRPVRGATPTEDLLVRMPGYKASIFRNFWITEGSDFGFKVSLDRGQGSKVRDLTHKMMRDDTESREGDAPAPGASFQVGGEQSMQHDSLHR